MTGPLRVSELAHGRWMIHGMAGPLKDIIVHAGGAFLRVEGDAQMYEDEPEPGMAFIALTTAEQFVSFILAVQRAWDLYEQSHADGVVNDAMGRKA